MLARCLNRLILLHTQLNREPEHDSDTGLEPDPDSDPELDPQPAMFITDGKEDEKLGNGRASLADIFPSIGD